LGADDEVFINAIGKLTEI